MTTLEALRTWGKRRLLRLGLIPSPAARAVPQADSTAYGGPSWFWLCAGAWTAMVGAFMACAPLIAEPTFIVKVGFILVAAFPAAYYLHFSRVSRWVVNWIVFGVAAVFGSIELILAWPHEGIYAFYGLAASFRILVKAFLWILAFRAFAVRTLPDLVLSVIPAVSCLILVLVASPTPLAAAGAAMVMLGALYLLAAERGVEARRAGYEVRAPRQVVWARGPQRGAAINTWQAVSVIVLIAALIAGMSASSLRFSSDIGRNIHELLARYLAAYLIGERYDYSPSPVVSLTGEASPQGDRVLFVVECDRGENWRQQTYAQYTGKSWQQARGRKRKATWRAGVWRLDTSAASGFRTQNAITVRQVFTLQAPISAALPGLFLATEVRASAFGLMTGEDGSIVCSGYMRPGESYEVTSLVPRGGPAPRAIPLPPLADSIEETYLQLPENLPPRIEELARSITAQARGPQDAALTIQNYLTQTCEYDLRPQPRPPGRDFVDHFLFDAQRGYCNHYASAMVVMCRAVGMPARFVTGFVAGEFDPDADTYEVRAKDAHSWAEAYIEGRGWQAFEPTPPLDEEDQKPTLTALLDRVTDVLADISLLGWGFARKRTWLTVWLSVAVISLLCAAVLQRRRWYGQIRLTGRSASPDRRACFVYGQMSRWLGYCGFPRTGVQPPLEYLASLAASAAPIIPEAARITDCFLRARYGPDGVTDQEASAAEQALQRLRNALFRQKAVRR